ncbi:MAG TPA: gliding motility-associated peptidyl-prolyl isomerase GldI [Salinimicrobium sp.]|nr:gliding motility-associated peptidyl-prolyl isomerase GldI [Salinimicrobium sp.]
MRKSILFLFCTIFVFSCKSPEARRPISQKSGSFIDESVAINKKIVAAQEQKIQKIIKKDTTNTYFSSPLGFWYYYNVKDSISAETPQYGDKVEFNYNMKTLGGEIIYSEEELSPKTYTMDKEKLFAGLRHGLKLMHEGETVTFLFPSYKVYGFYGDKNRIGSNVPIISTVTLNKINPKTNQANTNQNNIEK